MRCLQRIPWVAAAWLAAAAPAVRAEEVDHARSEPGMVRSQGDSLNFVRFNHKGDRLACGRYSDHVRLWDPRDWSLVGKVEAKGSLGYLCFSPDDRFLYVAAGSVDTATLARYDARTGKRDQTYEGHRGVADWIVVAPDGETLLTYGTFDRRTILWEARSGRILRLHERGGRKCLPSPDGRGLLHLDPEAGWVAEPFREESPAPSVPRGLPRPTGGATVVASRDGRWLVVGNETAEYPFRSNPGSLTLYERRDGTYRAIARVRDESPWPFRKLALSPDQRLIAAGGLRNRIRFYALPTLERVAEVRYPRNSADDYSLTTFAFSPDSRRLAVGMRRPVPGLVDLGTFERLMPWTGHGGKVTTLAFTKDGRRLRSVGRDNVLCLWDAATMKAVARHRLPDGYEVVGARPPYADRLFCVSVDTASAVVVDGTSGEVLFRITIPPAYGRDDVRWLSGDRVLLVGEDRDRLGFFDCARRKLAREIHLKRFSAIGEVAEDFTHLYTLDPPVRHEHKLQARRVDLETGAVRRLEPPASRTVTAEASGLVPGGRYFYLADPDVRIYDRATMVRVAEHAIDAKSLESVAFSGDGARFAAVVRGGPRHLIRVHETLSGRRLGAIPNASYHPHVVLDRTGARVAIVNDDATIERWTLPAPSK